MSMKSIARLSVIFGLAVALAVTMSGVAAPTATASPQDEPVEAGITVHKVPGLSEEFINGVDVSTILAQEASGVTYYDAAGQAADLFDVLADADVNWIRVRVWNQPSDSQGNGYGAGNVDVDRAIEIGKRATAAGMQMLVDFQYSDFWADPAGQKPPKAWAQFTLPQKIEAVHAYTEDSLEKFVEAGVDVGMVQIGNETTNGFVGTTDLGQRSQLFAAGSSAVREVVPDALVALHFTNPERAGNYERFASRLAADNVDYDVFASSYYPFWHGSPANLTTVLKNVADKYNKKVIVAETSWVYTLDDMDGWPNAIGGSSNTSAYPVSVQGQASALRDVMAAIHDVGPAGMGVFYWEPAWIPVGPPSEVDANRLLWEEFGSGEATRFASEYNAGVSGTHGGAWDNQTLFDATGHPLESLNTFRYARTGSVAPREVVSVQTPSITVDEGTTPLLPATVEVTYTDTMVEPEPVVWSDALSWIRGAGVYTIPGKTSGGAATTATVTVIAQGGQNRVINGSFEDADMNMWTRTGNAAKIETTEASSDGARALAFWAGQPYTVTLSQEVTGIPAGTYQARATTQGTNVTSASRPIISVTSGANTVSSPLQFRGLLDWHTTATDEITIGDDGSAEIRVDLAMNGGAWGTLDDIQLTPVVEREPVDSADLDGLLSDAAAIDRTDASSESIAALDDAIAIANVVKAGAKATQDDVDAVAALLQGALDALVPDMVGAVTAVRCLAKTAYVTVKTTNVASSPVTAVVSGLHGDKTFTSIAAGKSASVSFNTRSSQAPGGVVTVSARLSDGGDEQVLTLDHAAIDCR